MTLPPILTELIPYVIGSLSVFTGQALTRWHLKRQARRREIALEVQKKLLDEYHISPYTGGAGGNITLKPGISGGCGGNASIFNLTAQERLRICQRVEAGPSHSGNTTITRQQRLDYLTKQLVAAFDKRAITQPPPPPNDPI